jgi:hypothetical protein
MAAYRAQLSKTGGYDFIWPAIVLGEPLAWVYAVHEAAELQAFADLGVNPFDRAQFAEYLPEAHLRATVAELRYLRYWARQEGLDAPELTFAMENPVLKAYPDSQARWIGLLQSHENWPPPTYRERRKAAQFWQRVLRGERE